MHHRAQAEALAQFDEAAGISAAWTRRRAFWDTPDAEPVAQA